MMTEDTDQTAVEETAEIPAEETTPEAEPVSDEEPDAAEETPVEEPVEAGPQAQETEEPAPPAVVCHPSGGGVAGWPFVVYLAAWAALAAATAYILTGADASPVPLDDSRYPFLLLGGVTLAACGPLIALTTWFVAFMRAEKGCRGGLLTTALVRGASATLFGVLVWWGALLLVDALRLGLI